MPETNRKFVHVSLHTCFIVNHLLGIEAEDAKGALKGFADDEAENLPLSWGDEE